MSHFEDTMIFCQNTNLIALFQLLLLRASISRWFSNVYFYNDMQLFSYMSIITFAPHFSRLHCVPGPVLRCKKLTVLWGECRTDQNIWCLKVFLRFMRFWRKFPAGSVIDGLAFLYRVLPPGFVGQMQSTLQDVVCLYCSRPAMHCEKNEFPPPPPDELGNFRSQFFKKWTCRNLVTTLLPLFPTGFFFRIYVINWQQSFTFIISNAYIPKQMDVCCSTFSF